MSNTLSHVAILTGSAEITAAKCKQLGYDIGSTEDFPSEGTREIYVGSFEKDGLLLLMQATGPGPYLNALEKRGPGLHHVAVNVSSIDKYITSLAGSGWLMHPMSLHTMKHNTVYLARPGLRCLIEVQEVSEKSVQKQPKDRFISDVFIEGQPGQEHLLSSLEVPGLHLASANSAGIVIAGRRLTVSELAQS